MGSTCGSWVSDGSVHFEKRDIALVVPGAIQPMDALQLQAFGYTAPGLERFLTGLNHKGIPFVAVF